MKKLGAAIFLILFCFSLALAEEKENTQILFGQEMPAPIARAFEKTAWSGWTCRGGAMGSLRERTEWEWPAAMTVMEKDGEAVLCGLVMNADGEYYVDTIGENALVKGAQYEVFIGENRHFFIRQTLPNGDRLDMEWALILNLDGDGLSMGRWLLLSVVDWNGEGIYTRFMTSDRHFRIEEYIPGMAEGLGTEAIVRGFYPYGLEEFEIETFPKTIKEAESWQDTLGMDTAMVECMGMELNLRKGPGTSTESLGKYYNGTLMQVLEKGPEWQKVRIGETEGYVFLSYVTFGPESFFAFSMNEKPLPMGKAKEQLTLYSEPGSSSKAISQLEENTAFHILGYKGDWLHICIPREEGYSGEYFRVSRQQEMGWSMDLDGLYGYVRKSGVQREDSLMRLLGDERLGER